MDIQRSLLIAALVLVSIMLLTEWVQFQDANGVVSQPAEQRADAPVPDAIADIPADLPTSGEADEVPQASDSPAPMPTPAQLLSNNLIDVVTDSLQMQISLEGGDITFVSLPRHLGRLGHSDEPFRLLEQSREKLYVAQSGLIGPNGTDSRQGRPRFSSSSSRYEMAEGTDELIVDLRLPTENGITIVKRFRLHRGDYRVDVEYLVQNHSDRIWKAALYGQIKRDNSPDPGTTGGKLSIQPFLGFATRTNDKPYEKFTFEDIAETSYKGSTTGGWVALVQHYFISAWIPVPGQPNTFELLQQQASGNNIGRFTSPAVSVSPGASATIAAQFYAGPKDQYQLREISPGLDLTVDYGWLWWIAQPLFALLHFFATGEANLGDWSFQLGSGIGNWGWSIILLTVTVKAAFFHLSAASYRSMAKMRKLQPKMLELRERHANDRQKLSQETMELYRREKVNPLGGCLPILIQMPVFLALYWVLLESVELRHAPFLAWIEDLSVMDPYFVLPLLMGASMYFQQKLNPPPPDPMQAKIFQFMPIIFTVFFLFFPAGLVLYWLVNNLLSITQQWIITRQIERAA